MVFYVFAMHCVSTVVVVRRETNSWKWPFFQWLYMGALAWVLASLGELLAWAPRELASGPVSVSYRLAGVTATGASSATTVGTSRPPRLERGDAEQAEAERAAARARAQAAERALQEVRTHKEQLEDPRQLLNEARAIGAQGLQPADAGAGAAPAGAQQPGVA